MIPDPEENVVKLPAEIDPEEQAKRVMAEATRLANQAPLERNFWMSKRAKDLGVPLAELRAMVDAVVKENAKKAREAQAEERRIEARAEKQRKTAEHEQKREREREQRQIEKAAERKAKQKSKAFTSISKFPTESLQEKELEKLAKQLDEDLDTVRDEFAQFIGAKGPTSEIALGGYELETWNVEPWDEQIDTATLLQELVDKIRKHVVARLQEVLAVALWIMFAWVHEVGANFSPNLIITSPDQDCGKTTLLIDVVGRLVPKPFPGAEHTASTVYRTAHAHKPTLLSDNVDTLFQRKPDLVAIFEIGWKRGPKVPRTETVNGRKLTVWYDPFCPKACSLIGTNIPDPLLGRCIIVKLHPKLPEEKVDEATSDDETFANLRRKLKRWSDDNAVTLKDAKPIFPPGFTNRISNNWRLQLAIAEFAGAVWAKRARESAERLSCAIRKPSWLRLLLAEFRKIFASSRKEIGSKEFVAAITADPISVWHEYNRGGPITERQVAHLLRDLDIEPGSIGPKRLKGYREKDFAREKIFERYLPRDPLIRSLGSDGKK
jgi:hypothetical protein